MSTRPLPPSSTPLPPSKRARKAPPRNPTDEDKQRERKRALDRKAQRASREKTRSYIAHLESTVQILSSKNGAAATGALLEEMGRLHAEIERLRKIIESVRAVVGVSIGVDGEDVGLRRDGTAEGQVGGARRPSRSPDEAGTEGLNANDPNFEAASPSDESPAIPCNQTWHEPVENLPLQEMLEHPQPILQLSDDTQPILQPVDACISTSPNQNLEYIRQVFDWTNELAPTTNNHTASISSSSIAIPTSTATSQLQQSACPQSRQANTSLTLIPPTHQPRQLHPLPLPSPFKTSPRTFPTLKYPACKQWQFAVSIYNRLLHPSLSNANTTSTRLAAATSLNPSTLFRVVLSNSNWSILTPTELSNPLLTMLRLIERTLFAHLDPVTKLANLYKSHLLLKHHISHSPAHLAAIPPWQRPTAAQKAGTHPIAIDFFPWPDLRDALCKAHGWYFATDEFSVAYRRYFRFRWPGGIESTFLRDAEADGGWRVNPVFERWMGEVGNWALEERFFEAFPEFRGRLPVWEEGGDGVQRGSVAGVVDGEIGDGGAGAGVGFDGVSTASEGYYTGSSGVSNVTTQIPVGGGQYSEERGMMELFEDLPVT